MLASLCLIRGIIVNKIVDRGTTKIYIENEDGCFWVRVPPKNAKWLTKLKLGKLIVLIGRLRSYKTSFHVELRSLVFIQEDGVDLNEYNFLEDFGG